MSRTNLLYLVGKIITIVIVHMSKTTAEADTDAMRSASDSLSWPY